jgi:hypothetical protein
MCLSPTRGEGIMNQRSGFGAAIKKKRRKEEGRMEGRKEGRKEGRERNY